MDESQFERLYRSAAPRLVGVTYAVCGDLQEAQDCVHEAFVRAWSRRRSLDASGAPEAWLRLTAMRIAVSRWRHISRGGAAARRHGPPPDIPAPGPEHVDLVRAMRSLRPEVRMVVALHHLVDLPVDEVSRQTGIPVNTVKSHLLRGRDALRTALSETHAPEVDHA